MMVVIRPLLLSLLGAIITNYIILLITKNWIKASFYTAVILSLFFTHGHIVRLLVDNLDVSRKESIETISYAGLIIIAALMSYLISKTRGDLTTWINAINMMSIVLVLFPIMQISVATITSANKPPLPSNAPLENTSSSKLSTQHPDIYYIILDGYSRADTLEALGYDNSIFLKQLEEIGFYVATCSTSNYKATALSMPAALNMDYLWDAIPNAGEKDTSVDALYASLLHNRVRSEFGQRGYKIISFQTGYKWDEWIDADLYITPTYNLPSDELNNLSITPFEYLFLRNTALYSFIESGRFATERYYDHYHRTIFTLNELPYTALIPGPKFVYAHIMTPHNPFVFLPDGSLNTDSRYYDSEKGYPSNTELFTPGYLNSIKFLNSRLPDIIDEIIKNSDTPPVIVLQGDHGYIIPERRYNILNAYYLPGQEYDGLLYPSITPVNTFRIIFNQYFNTNLELRDDLMIRADIGGPYRKGRSIPFPESCP
jgi:hypothetical protein